MRMLGEEAEKKESRKNSGEEREERGLTRLRTARIPCRLTRTTGEKRPGERDSVFRGISAVESDSSADHVHFSLPLSFALVHPQALSPFLYIYTCRGGRAAFSSPRQATWPLLANAER